MKNILITGVSRGIGRTVAKHLHELGYHIYGGYKWSEDYQDEQDEAESLKGELKHLTLLPFDLSDKKALTAMTSRLEGVKLEGLVNNAAEFLDNSWSEFSEENWERSVAVNMSAPLLLAQKLNNNFVNGSCIINIASTDAEYAAYDDIGYAATKAGLISLTRSMAAALADRKIRVNAIAPGWVDTQMAEGANIDEYAHYKTPLGRNAATAEIAQVVGFLLSDASSFVNATVITVDGGYSSIDYVIKKESEG